MKDRSEGFKPFYYLLFTVITLAVMVLSICAGSVNISVKDTLTAVVNTILSLPIEEGPQSIIAFVRLPRVLCVALVGAALSLCGGAMQGLLRNPLADGSTLGVSSGASLGAVIAIAFGLYIPRLEAVGTMGMAMLFAFLSLVIILTITYKLDYSLSTNTIILIGVIFNMF